MEVDIEKSPVESIIKVEQEQLVSAVVVQEILEQKDILVKCENLVETEAVYIKFEEPEPASDIAIVKLEPQASLQPVLLLKRLSEATLQRWTRRTQSKSEENSKLRYICDVCGISVSAKNTIINHLNIHFQPPHLFCDLCPRGFRNLHRVRIHVKTHFQKKPYTCKICDYETCFRFAMVEHNITHLDRTECKICHKMVTVLKTHMKRLHSVRHRQVQCEACGKSMIKDKLARHMNMVHSKIRECPECKEKFTHQELKIHKLRAHYKGDLYECSKCDAVFKNNNILRTHFIAHSGGMKCNLCNREYAGPTSLYRHWKDKHRTSSDESFAMWKKSNKIA